MKKIIAPVDFSDASTNALSFAAELSKRASAQLLVVNIFEKGEDEEDSRDKLTTVVSNLKKSFRSQFKLRYVGCAWESYRRY